MLRRLRTAMILVIFVTTLSGGVAAATPCPDEAWVQRGMEAAQRSRDNVIVDHTNRSANAESIMDSLAKCLEKFKEIRATSSIGVPSLPDLFAGVAQKACSTADSLYNQAISGTQTQVMLPGNIGGVKVGLPGSGQLGNPTQPPNTVSVPGADVSVSKSSGGIIQETLGRIPAYIRGIFR